MQAEQRFRDVMRSRDDTPAAFLNTLPDASLLDSLALGRLMPDAWRCSRSSPPARPAALRAAHAVLNQARAEYDKESASAALETLTDLARAESPKQADVLPGLYLSWSVQSAAGVVEGLKQPISAALRNTLHELLASSQNHENHPIQVALRAIARPETQITRHELDLTIGLQRIELGLVADAARSEPQLALLAARVMSSWSDAMDDSKIAPPGEYPLARIAAFVAATRPCVESALKQVQAIQLGATPYAPDKALPLEDAHALARFVSIALDRSELWLEGVLEPLLFGVCIAPDPTANTAPSQAGAIGLAKAIAERPRPFALDILRRVASETRHAGLKKKLDRLAKAALRRLSGHPDFIVSLGGAAAIPKSLSPAVKQSFELTYLNGRVFSSGEFHAILANKSLRAIAENLVWVVSDTNGKWLSARPRKVGDHTSYIDDANGVVAVDPNSSVRLWHPLEASPDEGERWRDHIVLGKIKQPFNQVFREVYRLSSDGCGSSKLELFSGQRVKTETLLGVALSSGWQLSRYEGFYRSARGIRFTFDCGELYPGARGETRTGLITMARNGSGVPATDIDPILMSEVLRSVDLLTSVAAFAAESPEDTLAARDSMQSYDKQSKVQPGAQSARRRREVLRRYFGETPSAEAPWVDDRYLCIGDIKIHIATGHARRHGEPLDLPAGSGALTLPYADPILERIVLQANAAVRIAKLGDS